MRTVSTQLPHQPEHGCPPMIFGLVLERGAYASSFGDGASRHTARLLTEDGDLNRFVNVYVNGQDVRYLAGLDTPVAASDEVRLLPAMAGG